MDNAVTLGAVAVVIGLVLRLFGMSQMVMWQMSTLFESIGTVQDGIGLIVYLHVSSINLTRQHLMSSKVTFSLITCKFRYGKGHGVMDDLTRSIQPGEKVGIASMFWRWKIHFCEFAIAVLRREAW